MRAISDVQAGRIWPAGRRFPTSDLNCLVFPGEKLRKRDCCVFSDVPKLPQLRKINEEDDEEADDEEEDDDPSEGNGASRKSSSKSSSRKSKVKSGPSAANPYAEDSSSLVMPIMIAFGLFIPTLLCLCRL